MIERSLGVVIPVFNERGVLPHLIARLTQLQQALPRLNEVIFVDDGSSDDSFAILLNAVEATPGWRLIRLSRNFGQQAAVLAGIQASTTEAVVLMDADLQDPPELIPGMVALWDEGWDVVFAVRRSRRGESWLKRVSAKVFYRLLSRLSEIDIPVDTGDFRLMDRKVTQVLAGLREQRPYVRGLVAWAGFRQTGLAFDRAPREDGKTNYDLRKMARLSLDAIMGFSPAPLRLVTHIGIITALLSLTACCMVLGLWIAGFDVPGWTPMMLVILFLGSVQMISLGIIGEYLAYLTTESKGRPRFVIEYDSATSPKQRPQASRYDEPSKRPM